MSATIAAPTTLKKLLAIPPGSLNGLDVARMSLLCSEGLPGAEDVDLRSYLATLDRWAGLVDTLTKKHFSSFQQRKAEFENSEPLWRLLGVARILNDQCGIHYVPEERDLTKPANWKDSTRHMLHGLIGPQRHGTCASLPILLVAIGRRLGYPMRLVHSPGHVFSRWDAPSHPNPAWRERKNFEFHGDIDCYPDDRYYHKPVEWTPQTHHQEQLRQPLPLYLRSLTPAEELASLLVQRGHTFEAHSLWKDAMMAYAAACHFAPQDDVYVYFAKECNRLQLNKALEPWGLDSQQFCLMAEKRLRGHKLRYPWEHRFGQVRRGYNAINDPERAAVIKAAEGAVAARLAGRAPLPKAMQPYVTYPTVSPASHTATVRKPALTTFIGFT